MPKKPARKAPKKKVVDSDSDSEEDDSSSEDTSDDSDDSDSDSSDEPAKKAPPQKPKPVPIKSVPDESKNTIDIMEHANRLTAIEKTLSDLQKQFDQLQTEQKDQRVILDRVQLKIEESENAPKDSISVPKQVDGQSTDLEQFSLQVKQLQDQQKSHEATLMDLSRILNARFKEQSLPGNTPLASSSGGEKIQMTEAQPSPLAFSKPVSSVDQGSIFTELDVESRQMIGRRLEEARQMNLTSMLRFIAH